VSGELNLLDLFFVLILFFSFFFGLLRGLVRELLSLVFLIAALVIAFFYYQEAGLFLHSWIDNRELANFAGFLLVLALIAAVGSLITGLIGKYLVVGPLKALDRLLGAVFGLARGILLAGLVLYCFLVFPLNQDLLNRSQLAPHLASVITTGLEVLPPTLRDRLKLIKFYDYKKNNRTSRSI
jgi:membrane protein required for colicin V production